MKNYINKKRWTATVGQSVISLIEPVQSTTWIGKKLYQQAGFAGVPRNRLTLVIPESGVIPNYKYLVELGFKKGKYNNEIQLAIAIRDVDEITIASMPLIIKTEGSLVADQYRDKMAITIQTYDGLKIKVAEVGVLRTIPIKTAEGAREILAWHWTRYYTHLNYKDIEDLLSGFNITSENETLNGLNRRASRLLYARSRELGWKKMTIRERIKYGFDGSAWQRIAVVEERMSKTGCGEYTLRAASGSLSNTVKRRPMKK